MPRASSWGSGIHIRHHLTNFPAFSVIALMAATTSFSLAEPSFDEETAAEIAPRCRRQRQNNVFGEKVAPKAQFIRPRTPTFRRAHFILSLLPSPCERMAAPVLLSAG